MIKLFNSALSLLLAGSFLIFCAPFRQPNENTGIAETDVCAALGGRVKDGVLIDGTPIGGMRYADAEQAVRETIRNRLAPFTVKSPAGDLNAALSFCDDVPALVRKAKKGESLVSSATRTWAGAEDDIMRLCKRNAKDAVDAKVFFTAEGFFYTPEEEGVVCDYMRSLQNALAALDRGETESELVTYARAPEITIRTLKERTKKLASFTTYFDGGNLSRVHNIALAASRIAGTTILPHGEFSFNGVVGKRTKENGFEDATVIFDGEFVPGVGGGVCQASTTLMNAAIHAGLKITESRSHSLSVSYVPPSLDAMVSEYSDLKFENPYEFPVYLSAKTGKNYVTFTVYGKPDGKRYETESSVRFRLTPPPAEIVEGDEEKVIRAEKEGLASESYLVVYDENGKVLSRKLFRRDTYAVVQGIYQIAKQPQPEADGAADEREILPENPKNE